MRILHTADWHLGKSLEGQTRLYEQEQFLKDFIAMAEEYEPDVILIAGDIYDSVNPPARAEKLFYETLKELSPNGERLIVVIAGNHDSPERLVAAGPLAMEHGIVMAGVPGSVALPGEYGRHRITESGPGWLEVQICKADGSQESAVILTVPYPSEKRLAEVIYRETEDEERQAEEYAKRMERLFRMLETHYRSDTVNLMCAHLFVMDARPSGSERALSLGGSYLIAGDILPKKADYIALGHVHKPQVVPGCEKRARYAGAPIHYHKDETAYQNLCLLVDIDAVSKECQVRELPVPVYKPIEIWKCKSIEEALTRCRTEAERNAYVYLEIETERYIREDEMKEMKLCKQDILEIRPVIQNRRTAGSRPEPSRQRIDELFAHFYEEERGAVLPQELKDLFLEIAENGEDDETDQIDA